MNRLLLTLLFLPLPTYAQTKLVTEFPEGAKPLTAEALKERFSESDHAFRGANGAEIRLQFQGSFAQIGAPDRSDSGPWKIEGSAICFELKKFPSGCNEVRVAGEVLYWKRISNGEVVQLYRK